MSFDSLLNQLSQTFAQEFATRFAAMREANPTETFCGIATCHECDSYSCYLAANSEEAIIRELEQRAGGGPIDGLSSDRFWVPEWPFEDDAAFALDLHEEVWNAAEQEGVDDSVSGRRVFDAYVSGLQQFEASGALNPFDREKIILIPWVHDPCDENTWVLQAVEQLNPKSVSAAFAEEYGYAD